MNALYYVPLGGAGEIGMNMYLYGYGEENDRRWIMVDCGIGFPEAAQAPGVETMTADPAFIAERADRLEAIFITHAHEDHVGAVGRLWARLGAPVYCTAFTAEIARRKFEEMGQSPKAIKIRKPNDPQKAGPFEVSFFPMTHSVPETSALVIRTPLGVIFHTADFKIDPNPIYGEAMDKAALAKLGEEGVLALACDSTNVFDRGVSGNERDIQAPLIEAVRQATGKVAATTFASNVARLKSLADAAKANDREIVVAGRAMRRMLEAAVKTVVVKDFPETLSEDRARDLPDEHLFYLVTGSQGEGRAAMARIAHGTHPAVTLTRGDTALFSSKTIPGNEVEVARIYNKLAERGVKVIDSDMADIHVSGHACRDELKEMYDLLKPRFAIPMHGERRHLEEHSRCAMEWGATDSAVAANGTMLRITKDDIGVCDDVETGRLYIDGDLLIGAMDGVVRSRRKMGLNGALAVSVVIDEAGDLVVESDVRAIGAPEENVRWDGAFEEIVAEAVDNAIEGMPAKRRRDDAAVEDMAMVAARRAANKLWGKKPETVVMLTRLEAV